MVVGKGVVLLKIDPAVVEEGPEPETEAEGAPPGMGTELLDLITGELAVFPGLVESLVQQPVPFGELCRLVLGDHVVFEQTLEKLISAVFSSAAATMASA